MKTIGLIGGMSWESTAQYYALINRGTNEALGKNHSAKCLVHSFDFQEIEELQYRGDWETLRARIMDSGRRLKLAGAELIVLCTNTMHKVVDGFESELGVPLLHIAQAVGDAIAKSKLKRVGLLGTSFTMEQDFYKNVLIEEYGLDVLIPRAEDRAVIHRVIYEELVKGIVREDSKHEYYRIMDRLKDAGAQGIILGCTEIGLLIDDYDLPLFDSTTLHAKKAVEVSLEP